MSENNPDFKALLDALIEPDVKTLDPLSEEEIARWCEKSGDEETRRALQRRLILDREAVAKLIGRDLGETSPEQAALASWNQFEKKLDRVTALDDADEDLPFPDVRPRRPIFYFRLPQFAVAALCVLAILLGFRLNTLGHRVQELERPSLSDRVQLVDLGGSGSRDSSGPPVLSQGKLTLRLRLSNHLGDADGWQVTLLDPERNLIFRDVQQMDSLRVLTLTLVRDFFTQPGQYQVEVAAMNHGAASPAAEFPFLVE